MEKLVFNQKLSTMIKNTNKVENILVLNTFDIKHLNLPVFFFNPTSQTLEKLFFIAHSEMFQGYFCKNFQNFFY